jgi:coproporphyrinogen III oxidase
MPSHDTQSSPSEGVSRRSVIRGAATAGVAGLAATALSGALSPAASASTRASGAAGTGASAASAAAGTELKASGGPIVVHVRNAKTGDIEVFSGTSQTRLHDTDLAARIARAIA